MLSSSVPHRTNSPSGLQRSNSAPTCPTRRRTGESSPHVHTSQQITLAQQDVTPAALARDGFERRLSGFPSFAKVTAADAATQEWLSLLVVAVEHGTPHDMQVVLQLAPACLPEQVDQALLLAALDCVPRLHCHATAGASQALLSQCLQWAGSLGKDAWQALLNGLQQACQGLSRQAENEIQDMFLGLLGVDAMRIFMAQPGRLLTANADAPAGTAVGVALPATSLFMRLPKELRRAIFQWIIPAPGAGYAQSVQEHGANLMTISRQLKNEVQPLLDDSRRIRRGHWSCADLVPGSPVQAIDGFHQRWRGLVELKTEAFASVERWEEWGSARDKVVAQFDRLKQLACVICLCSDAQDVPAAMAAMREVCAEFEPWIAFQDVSEVFCVGLALAYEGRESEEDFHWLLETLRSECDLSGFPTDNLVDQMHLHLLNHLPPDGANAQLNATHATASMFLKTFGGYWNEMAHLTDGERLYRLSMLELPMYSLDSLSVLSLITRTHQASQAEHGPLAGSVHWWNLAARVVGAFLSRLNAIWPYDMPLPARTLFERLPPGLLRWTFQTLKPDLREALLHRPVSFGQDGACLQLPLVCDFCLDDRIPQDKRTECLSRWGQQSPVLATQLQEAAWEWQVLSGPPVVNGTPYPADGSEAFSQDCIRVSEDLAATQDLAVRQHSLKALLNRARGPQDFFATLQLVRQWLPESLHGQFSWWSMESTLGLCQDQPQMYVEMLRTWVLPSMFRMEEGGQFELLESLARASVLYSADSALVQWTGLTELLYMPGSSASKNVQKKALAILMHALNQYARESSGSLSDSENSLRMQDLSLALENSVHSPALKDAIARFMGRQPRHESSGSEEHE